MNPRLRHILVLIFLFTSAFDKPDSAPGPVDAHTLKILCYNIHHASPPSRPDTIDLDAIARVINDQQPDLVALQEVDVFTRRSGPHHQAAELALKTGLKPYFFKAINFEGGEYGIAILSRYPVIETNRYPLPTKEESAGEPRVLGTAKIQLSSKESILFACTHLDAQRDASNRLLQMNAIAGHLEHSKDPVILAGDFNAIPGSQVIRLLDKSFTRTCDPCDFTIPVDKPDKAIDFITFSPAEVFKVKQHVVVPERYASDHLPVFSVLEVNFDDLPASVRP